MPNYPIDFPSSLPVSSMTIDLVRAVSSSRSPFSLHEQIYDWGGEAWEIQLQLSTLTRENCAAYRAFVTALKGKMGTFTFNLIGEAPYGSYAGTPLLDGGSQTGSSIDIKGFTADATGVIKAGDYFSLGSGSSKKLFTFLADADADSSGGVTVEIAPEIKIAFSDEEAINTSTPGAVFRLDDNTVRQSIDKHNLRSASIGARQSL